ncbi:hypothetical protein T459_19309 [Capsicum annuum]|uniref:FAD/NAD(P)-binding domain-containing protein n=1 Tax=Capsicum annuum TaxID=4072 RepID=A0A2G2Z191_CAPAN|nr:hypothetical protein T459_19309 [Capsicum annuum]
MVTSSQDHHTLMDNATFTRKIGAESLSNQMTSKLGYHKDEKKKLMDFNAAPTEEEDILEDANSEGMTLIKCGAYSMLYLLEQDLVLGFVEGLEFPLCLVSEHMIAVRSGFSQVEDYILKLSNFGVQGADSKNILYLREINDATKIMEALKVNKNAKAVVVGGGYVGLELTIVLRMNNIEVDMVYLELWCMPQLFTEGIVVFYEACLWRLAGSTAALFTTPFDVVKKRLQTQVIHPMCSLYVIPKKVLVMQIPGSRTYFGVFGILQEIGKLKALNAVVAISSAIQMLCSASAHSDLAHDVVCKSLVLLKNGKDPKKPFLPLDKTAKKILVDGAHADDLGFPCVGWTTTWTGLSGRITVRVQNEERGEENVEDIDHRKFLGCG